MQRAKQKNKPAKAAVLIIAAVLNICTGQQSNFDTLDHPACNFKIRKYYIEDSSENKQLLPTI